MEKINLGFLNQAAFRPKENVLKLTGENGNYSVSLPTNSVEIDGDSVSINFTKISKIPNKKSGNLEEKKEKIEVKFKVKKNKEESVNFYLALQAAGIIE